MKNTIANLLASVTPEMSRRFLKTVIYALGDRMSSHMLNTAGLVIKGAGETVAKTGAVPSYAVANGVLRTMAAALDMPALVGTVLADQFNVFVFSIDSAGVVTSKMGTEGASLATVVLPSPTEKVAMIGMIVINPTGTGNFVGGTTDLDDATVVPTAAYISFIGAGDPTILLGPTQ
jgi:hypothetical protein